MSRTGGAGQPNGKAGSGAVPGISGGRGADFSPFVFIVGLLYSGAAISSGALAAWEQEKCAQHTLWMCQSLTESKH